MKIYKLISISVFILFASPSLLTADVPKLFSYSGRLMNKNGTIIADGIYDMRFKLFDGPAGPELWSEEHLNTFSQGIQVRAGSFNVMIGGIAPGNPLPAFDKQLYLETAFKLPSETVNDYKIFNRQQIISVPYALQAGKVDANGVTTTSIMDGAVTQEKAPFSPSIYYYTNTNGNNPTATLKNKFKILYGTGLSDGAGHKTIEYPADFFSNTPVVMCTGWDNSEDKIDITIRTMNIGAFTAVTWSNNLKTSASYIWMALGE
jgi:hypothetical protein